MEAWEETAREGALAELQQRMRELGQRMQECAGLQARIAVLHTVLGAVGPAGGAKAPGREDGPGAGGPPQQGEPALRVVPGPGRGRSRRNKRSERVRALLDGAPGRQWKAREIAEELGIPNVRSLRGSLQDMVERGEIARPGKDAVYQSAKAAAGTGRERAGAAGGLR